MSVKNRRKVLVPLATLLAAGAVAVGSGATFTSTTASTTSVASGKVEHTHDVTSLDITNIKPGDVIRGSVKITNTGTLPAGVTLRETSSTNGFNGDNLKLRLLQGDNVLFNGTFGALADDTVLSLGDLAVAGSTSVQWEVTLVQTAGNTDEGRTASASYQWVSTQQPGVDLPFLGTVGLPLVGN